MSADTAYTIIAVLSGFIVHLVYFGRWMGKVEATIMHLGTSFDEFKASHFIPREEFEARHAEMMTTIAALTKRAE